MRDKTRLITPFLMLTAGAVASIIMFVRKFELTTMLWILLVVLLVFYVLGDVARYIYASIKPRVIPQGNLSLLVEEARRNGDLTGNVVEFENEEGAEGDSAQELDADGAASEDEGYSDEELSDSDDEEAAES